MAEPELPAEISPDRDTQGLKGKAADTRAALGTSNRRLQAVLDAASEVSIIATDPEGMITIFNRGAEKMLGYSAHELVGKETLLAFHLASELAGRARLLGKELGRPVSGFDVLVEKVRLCGMEQQEWTYVRKDGSMLLVNLSVTIIRDEAGGISGFLGTAEDITRRKAMEHQIIEHEKLLEKIIDSIPSPIFYKDENGVYVGCNDAFCAYLGMPRERIVGSTVFDLAPVDLAEVYHRADLELLGRREPQTYEASVERTDGERRDVIFYKSCIFDQSGLPRGLVGVILDITDRKRVELELSRREELFHLLFEKSGDGNLLIDGGVFIDCNAATLRMLGLTHKEQVISLSPERLSPPYQSDGRLSSEKASEMIETAYRQGSHRFEWQHLRSDGTLLPVEVMLTCIPMNDRRIIHTAWRDLSAQKQAEAENERLTQNLLHAQKIESIGRLAGGVAHDFNNLLTPIIVYSELLKKQCADIPKAAQMLSTVVAAAGKARDLTSQLLAFGRKQRLQMKVMDLNRSIRDFALILERAIRENVRVETRLAPNLEPILADPSQIEQIVMNLVLNAQDSMPTGGSVVIETAACSLGPEAGEGPDLPPGEYVRLRVSDNGCGMDPDTKSRIFEPFFTTKKQGKGTGLGLATVFGIVEQHGGHVGVQSELGRGSVFTIHFPCAAGESLQETEREAQEIPLLGRGALILLVEDNEMVCETTRDLLLAQGHRVLVAATPAAARAAMAEHGDGIELILSDVVMPEMDGPTLYRELSLMRPGLKVLFMSGYSENVVARHGSRIGDFNYIHKPFSPQVLATKVNEVLAGSRAAGKTSDEVILKADPDSGPARKGIL